MPNKPEVQRYVYDSEQSGIFYLRSVSPVSFNLDPYWFFLKNDFNTISADTKNQIGVDLNPRKYQAQTEARMVGLRGPLLMSGWGYDTAGLPTPSLSVNALTHDPDTPTDRSKWKTGPIDLRWDEGRKVWVGGPEIIEGTLSEDLAAPSDIDPPTKGKGNIRRGKDLAINQETVTLYNRNPALSFQSGDYFMAAKVNYEWRPIGGGGGGAGSGNSGNILMVLGTYDQYSGCPGVPARPPTGAGGTLCWPAFAWASYRICGYKYIKTGDTRGYGKWAEELNGGGGTARVFYPAFYGGDGNCKGVRFMGCCGSTSINCSCPSKIEPVTCFKISFSTPSAPPEGYLTECNSTQSWYNDESIWDQSFSFTLCGSNCSYIGTDGTGTFTASLNFVAEPISGNNCYWGPSEFDPCNPCEDFGHWDLTIEVPGGSEPNCGAGAHFTGKFTLSQLNAIVDSCTTQSPTQSVFCNGCGNGQDPPVEFHFINDDVTLTCCNSSETTACSGGGGGGGI